MPYNQSNSRWTDANILEFLKQNDCFDEMLSSQCQNKNLYYTFKGAIVVLRKQYGKFSIGILGNLADIDFEEVDTFYLRLKEVLSSLKDFQNM